jgi:transcriptional regulator with XRE-family HTH domain
MGQGELIRAQRLAAGLTQSELAEQIGCSEAYVSLLERDLRRGSPSFMKHLAQVLAEVAAA